MEINHTFLDETEHLHTTIYSDVVDYLPRDEPISEIPSEIVGVNDIMYLVLWVRYFLESQGYGIKDNIVYQVNQSSMKLEQNGKTSSTKNSRHMEIRYYFITDNIRRNKLSIKYCPTGSILDDYYTKSQ